MLLWPDQLKACTAIDNTWESGKARRIVLCSPTGSGKTVVATSVAMKAHGEGKRVTFLAPRIELITQMCSKLDEWLPCGYGVITAKTRPNESTGMDLYNRVQVASVDTLVSRAVKRGNFYVPPTDVLICDEAHLYITEHRLKLMSLFGDQVRVLGLTATPAAPNNKGLASAFDTLIEVTTPKKLIQDGYLVKPQYKAPSVPDLKRVRITAGEYNAKDVEVVMSPLLGDILEHWFRYGSDRRTILFADSVAHSLYLRNKFIEAGVAAEHCDAKTETGERARLLKRFRTGETQVLCNVDIATYGFDLPEISCVVDADPTKSLVKFIQRGGRGMRRAPGKSDMLYLDHAGNIHEHGYLEEDRFWSLEDGCRPLKPKPRSKKRPSTEPPKNLTCPECRNVFSGSLTCVCGYYFEALAREFHVVDGELVAFTTDDESNVFARCKFYCELLAYAQERGKKPRWCDHTYHERFTKWPPLRWAKFAPIAPSPETLRYIRYRNIKRAKELEARQRRRA